MNGSQCYVIRTLPLLFVYCVVLTHHVSAQQEAVMRLIRHQVIQCVSYIIFLYIIHTYVVQISTCIYHKSIRLSENIEVGSVVWPHVHGSQVKGQGRRHCCHSKHKKYPYRPTRDVSLLSGHVATPPNQLQRCILTDYFNNYNFVCLFPWRYNPLWLYFHSPVSGFSLLVFEVS
jgi:hypothetical protein